jgi:hypothetical protein
MENWFSRYFIAARVIPSIYVLLPFALVWCTESVSTYWKGVTNGLNDYVAHILLLPVFIVLVKLVRYTGLKVESYMFANRTAFPSVYLMEYGHPYFSDEIKTLYREKMNEAYAIGFKKKADELTSPVEEGLAKLREASKCLSSSQYDVPQVVDRNIEYGFLRNLTGSCFLTTIFSTTFAISKITPYGHLFCYLAMISVVISLGIYILALRKSSEDYAKQAILSFVTKTK